MVLQSIRDRLNGIIAIFILGLLIIPFAFVGVSSYFTSDAVNAVAVVNDEEITINQFNQSFQNYRRRMQAQLGAAFDPAMFDQPIVRRQFLDQMIDERLLAQVSLDAGLAVDNETLAEAIRSLEGFHVDGEFNADVYQARLATQGLTPQSFENEMRGSMVMNQFPTAIATSAFATNWELQDYARFMGQERSFSAILVPAAESAAEAVMPEDETEAVEDTAETVEESEILAWYESNGDDFMSEEQVIIEYIELNAATLGGSVEPDEETLRARFEDQQARFVTPESRLASHILIEVDNTAPEVDIETARQVAEDLSRQARDGADFAELAREHSQDIGSASEGGDLDWVEPGVMVQAFEDGLYALTTENPVSEPVQTGFGWHVIYLREIRPSEGMTFTEAREILLSEYMAEADELRFLEQADRMVDIIYEDPTTLEAAAEELGLEVQEAGPFTRNGTQLGITANPEIVEASFSDLVLGQGSVSDPIDLSDNHIAMVLVKEHLPVALIPLEDVREDVVAAIRADRALAAAAATADALLARVEAGEAVSGIAEAEGLELVTAEGLIRQSVEVDTSLRDEVFLLPRPAEGESTHGVVEVENGFAVVQLDTVVDGELTEDDAIRKQAFSRRLANGSANVETFGFLRMLRAQSLIEVYEDRL